MPELPEIETIKRALERCLPGVACCNISVFSPKLRTSLDSLRDPALLHTPFVAVRRRGRYLVLELAGRRAFLLHLGMSGVLRVEAPRPRRKHEHVIADLDNGMTLRFECPRRFSIFEAVSLPAPGAEPAALSELGIEPLEAGFTGQYLFDRLQRHHIPVKNALMDNAIVTGIGNIYATEALFAARIAPQHRSDELTLRQCTQLVASARKVLLAAIEAGGTTLNDYRHVDGGEGKFVQALQIYGKSGEACPECGTPLTHLKLGGRTSCYCPHCQK